MVVGYIRHLRVDMVSSMLRLDGLIVANMAVLEFPPSDSLRSQVSTESRYGTNNFLFLLEALVSANTLITFPRVSNDL